MMTIFGREHRGYTCGMGTVMLEDNSVVKVVFVFAVVVLRLRVLEQQHGYCKKQFFLPQTPLIALGGVSSKCNEKFMMKLGLLGTIVLDVVDHRGG